MKFSYLSTLPEQVQHLALEVESLIGSEIDVQPRTAEDLALVPAADLAFCDCSTNQGVTTVTIKFAGAEIDRHILIHEILHAHRNLVGKIHRLVAAVNEERAIRFATTIDNDIEHLHIIPLEILFAPEATQYWESHYDRRLSEVLASPQEHPMVRRGNLLRHWLVTSNVIPKWSGLPQLHASLAAEGWLNDAVKLVEKVGRVKSNKAQCASTLIRFLKLDPARYSLSQFFESEGTKLPKY